MFQISVHQSGASVTIYLFIYLLQHFLYFHSYLSHVALFPFWRYCFLAAVLLWRPFLVTSRAVGWCTWMLLVSCWIPSGFKGERKSPIAALSFLGHPLHVFSSTSSALFVLLLKRLNSTSSHPCVLFSVWMGEYLTAAVKLLCVLTNLWNYSYFAAFFATPDYFYTVIYMLVAMQLFFFLCKTGFCNKFLFFRVRWSSAWHPALQTKESWFHRLTPRLQRFLILVILARVHQERRYSLELFFVARLIRTVWHRIKLLFKHRGTVSSLWLS